MIFLLYLKFSQIFEQQKSQLAIYLLRGHRILSYQLFDTNISSLGILVVEIYMFPLVYPLYFSVIFLSNILSFHQYSNTKKVLFFINLIL